MKSGPSHSVLVFTKRRGTPQKAFACALVCLVFALTTYSKGLPLQAYLFTGGLSAFFLILAAFSVATEELYVNKGGLFLKRDAFLSIRDSSRFYSFGEARGIHFVRSATDQFGNYTICGGEMYSFCYTDTSGKSIPVLEDLQERETEELSRKLCPHLPAHEQGSSILVVNSSFKDFVDRHCMVFRGLFIIPFLAVIGFASVSDGASGIFSNTLSTADAAMIQEELSPECDGKKYCLVSFFANWCPVSRGTKRMLPALEFYLSDRDDVGMVTFIRDTRWGQAGADEEEWQRDMQRTLLQGLSVPGFVVLKDGKTIVSSYKGGVSGQLHSEEAVETFLSKFLDADYLLKEKK